jgi:hypothetical protein
MKIFESGRRADLATGDVQPWYTHAALNEIQSWKLRDMIVLEWGGGDSSLWWAKRCRKVFTIEESAEWCNWISAQAVNKGIANLSVLHRPSSLHSNEYTKIPDGCEPNIVIVDGANRIECLAKTLMLPRPLTIIFDNWRKGNPSFWHQAEAMMSSYLGVSHAQHDVYVGHQPWQTAIWHLALDASRPPDNVRASQQQRQTLSSDWDGRGVERRFDSNYPGLAVIDDVLTDQALKELSRSLLGLARLSSPGDPRSDLTQYEVRHPFLDSVAMEFQRRLPRIIGTSKQLRSAYNYELQPERGGLRRDFAAISVTLWIARGNRGDGLVFYDVQTSNDGSLNAFEPRDPDIRTLTAGLRRATSVNVRYRRNRAVIASADLLHERPMQSSNTDDDRINLTLLFGDRRPPPAFEGRTAPALASPRAWRSSAFRRVRQS